MDDKLTFAVVGGDERQAKLASLLCADGHTVHTFALECAETNSDVIQKGDITELSRRFDCVIFPLPIKNNAGYLNAPLSHYQYSLETLFSLLPTGQTVIGGKLDNSLFEKAAKSGIRLYDYLEREDFTVLNSIPTAEGAIEVAMHETETVLNRKKCLVIGFGHIGKLLSQRLCGLGAYVIATARKAGDLAWISAYGYDAVETGKLGHVISDADIIFNTVPSLILDEKLLSLISPNAFICDLASKPGGVDFNAAKQLGIHTVQALSLPGKCAPVTAAQALRDTIYNILDEWRN